jgi:hypothetical protein
MRSVLLVSLVSTVAFAQQSYDLDERPATSAPSLELSLKAGGRFPQVVSGLGTALDGVLKVGYAPLSSRQLQFFADVGYAAPSQTLEAQDPRLGEAGSPYTSTLVLRDLATTFGVSWFILPPSSNLLPYAGGGLRAHFLSAEVEGGAQGAAFGPARETDTRFGAILFGGAGYRIGPGMVLGELAFDYTPIAHFVTGPSNVGALSVRLGYGILL